MAKKVKNEEDLAAWKAAEVKRLYKISKAYRAKGKMFQAHDVLDCISLIEEATLENFESKKGSVNVILGTISLG